MAHREDLDILIVEDNPGDVRLVREALKACASSHRLQVARDGEEALAMLRRQPPHQGSSRPNLVLLDLNLPRMDGRELLAQLKHDPELRRIPVVVLTTSGAERDVQSSQRLRGEADRGRTAIRHDSRDRAVLVPRRAARRADPVTGPPYASPRSCLDTTRSSGRLSRSIAMPAPAPSATMSRKNCSCGIFSQNEPR